MTISGNSFYDPAIVLLGIYPKDTNVVIQRGMCLRNVHNSQTMERVKMSIDRWMDKEDVVHIYTMEYYAAIKRNEILPFPVTWMELEGIILSEISQSEKEKYHVISLIYGI